MCSLYNYVIYCSRKKPVLVRALKALLIARSSVFEKMFTGRLAETQDVIPVTDIDPQTFYELIRYSVVVNREA